jgi:ornithine decarboxylase
VAEGLPCFFTAIAAAKSLLPEVELLAEPGRALVADGVSLVTRVLHRDADRVYLNDGVWGSLIEPWQSQGRFRFPTRVLRRGEVLADARAQFTVFGPTCDSLDRMPKPLPLPRSIATGDWVEFGQIGAYSLANRTAFNGIFPDRFVRIDARALPPGFAWD